jgi:serine acetyltransferase
MPGLHIADRALIGAASFVNKDVPDGVMVAGSPAKEVKAK